MKDVWIGTKSDTMKINYRQRCVFTTQSASGMEYEVVVYGMTAKEVQEQFNRHRPLAGVVVRGMPPPCERDPRGRRPGSAEAFKKHFFNKRIMTDEERLAHQAIQGDRNLGGVGALYGEGSLRSAGEAEASEGCAGCGGPDARDGTY